jgi:predicted esterase
MIFGDFQARMNELIGRGAYAEALDFVTREGEHFPLHASRIRLWRMGLACRLNDTTQALQILDQALVRGLWLPVAWLTEHPDLQPLQELPEFGRMVEFSREYEQAAREQAVPRLITLRPEGDQFAPPYPLLLALHGNFRDAASSVDPWRSACSRGWLVALPQSSQVFAPGAYIWDDGARAEAEVYAHFTTLCARDDVDCARSVVAGFSVGGGLAINLALSGEIRVQGLIAIAPYIESLEALAPLLAPGKAPDLRVYLIAGELDHAIVSSVQRLAELLESNGIACYVEIDRGLTHDFPSPFEQSLDRALDFIFGGGGA